jgi:hypothetical protein
MGVMRSVIDIKPYVASYYSDAFNTYHALCQRGARR